MLDMGNFRLQSKQLDGNCLLKVSFIYQRCLMNIKLHHLFQRQGKFSSALNLLIDKTHWKITTTKQPKYSQELD